MNNYIYDIEIYPNIFLLGLEHAESGIRYMFEISDSVNQSKQIIEFLGILRREGARMVGFNNLGFDYPILHTLVKMGHSNAKTLYDKAQAIIDQQNQVIDFNPHFVPSQDRFVPQIDLYKIHHFDNKARSTGLKVLEFNMRSNSIQELPFKPGTILSDEQIVLLKTYNWHDISETKKFYLETIPMIQFREELTRKYGRDFMNHNDTKIGKDYFIMELEKSGVKCYEFKDNRRVPIQTKRDYIDLNEAILPQLKFKNPEFQRVLNWLRSQKINDTVGVFKDLTAKVDGFEFVFGLGGIHGSVESRLIESNEDSIIIDLDVSSYYPNLAITNKFYPEHLGERFCDIYENLYEQRSVHRKGSTENAMLKLALNGVYGDSNNKFSPFYDPLFTMKITLNGQLLLCKLVEKLSMIDLLEIVQINTDGITVKVPKNKTHFVYTVCEEWEKLTNLKLENSQYKRMFVRDVNNYLAEYKNGTVKRKGAYEYELDWHQNHSALVVPKVAEEVLLCGASIRETIENWPDFMDFMLRTKVPRSSYLTIEENGKQNQLQNITRYYVAKGGGQLTKWMPPLKGKTEWRQIGIEAGWGVQVINEIGPKVLPIDYDYYIQKVEDLCLCLN